MKTAIWAKRKGGSGLFLIRLEAVLKLEWACLSLLGQA
jgi:hypothetical protein